MRTAVYAAQIMDEGNGRIVQTANDAGATDDTLVFFFSGNGAFTKFSSSGKSKAANGTAETFATGKTGPT